MNNDTKPRAPGMSTAKVMALAAIAALVGFAAVYGTLGQPDNTADNTGVSGAEAPKAETDTPAARKRAPGLPAFVYKQTPEPLADVSFVDADGAPKTLKDFRGKTIRVRGKVTLHREKPQIVVSDPAQITEVTTDKTQAAK